MAAYFVYPLKHDQQRMYNREDIENPRLKTEQEAIEEALHRSTAIKYAVGVYEVTVVSQEPYKLESEVKHIVYRGKLYSPEKTDIV